METLRKLRRLDIQSNRLECIGDGLLNLELLEELYLSHMGIKSIEGLDGLRRLTTLDLTANQIKDVAGGLHDQAVLEELWLGENSIESLSFIDNISHMKCLKTIYLERNPIENDKNYRQKILSSFPGLRQLDASLV